MNSNKVRIQVIAGILALLIPSTVYAQHCEETVSFTINNGEEKCSDVVRWYIQIDCVGEFAEVSCMGEQRWTIDTGGTQRVECTSLDLPLESDGGVHCFEARWCGGIGRGSYGEECVLEASCDAHCGGPGTGYSDDGGITCYLDDACTTDCPLCVLKASCDDQCGGPGTGYSDDGGITCYSDDVCTTDCPLCVLEASCDAQCGGPGTGYSNDGGLHCYLDDVCTTDCPICVAEPSCDALCGETSYSNDGGTTCYSDDTCTIKCIGLDGCADGSNDDIYTEYVVGCNGVVSLGDASSLCSPGWHVCSLEEYLTNGGDTQKPTATRWISDKFDVQNWCDCPEPGGLCPVFKLGTSKGLCAHGLSNRRTYSGADCASKTNIGWWANCGGEYGTMCCNDEAISCVLEASCDAQCGGPATGYSDDGGTTCYSDDVCTTSCVKLSLIFIPVNWGSGWPAFDTAADTQANELVQNIPLKDCSDSVEIIKVHSNCVVGMTPAIESCDCGDLFTIEGCALASGEDYDYVIGLEDSDVCEAIAGFSCGMGTIFLDSTGVTEKTGTTHELGHEWSLNDEYVDACKCGFGLVDPTTNCLDRTLDGDLPTPPYTADYCAEGPLCPSEYDITCYGNKNPSGGRCIMSFAGAPEPRAFCQHCWNYYLTLDFINC